ncbi:GAF and ANTAR domain-containing protein [Actinokineospora terrae]|uniref:GAF domain-containing protein n=1 Tax=Actinokineospora terrae TaxID=155974 RepID=A0A1H9VB38_9PSEU|nr:GAF and ANTAR domain-containing protein [Actinokineospora terrae]SES18778.1 GAF domain-containing protein [Actinokineospora terrae]
MATRARLADVLIDLSDTLGSDFDLLSYLRRLTDHCADLGAADTAAVLLADSDGTLRSTDPHTGDERLTDLFDEHHAHGPGGIAFGTATATGGPVTRWAGIAEAATAAGFRQAHAVPMRLRGTPLGAVCLYRVADRPFDAEEIAAVQAAADMAAVGINAERAVRQRQTLADQLQAALESRILIEQAKGVLAERHHQHVSESFRELRSLSRSHNLKIAQVAEEVVRSAALSRLSARG